VGSNDLDLETTRQQTTPMIGISPQLNKAAMTATNARQQPQQGPNDGLSVVLPLDVRFFSYLSTDALF
jgi:hypothetical protein